MSWESPLESLFVRQVFGVCVVCMTHEQLGSDIECEMNWVCEFYIVWLREMKSDGQCRM